MQLLNLICLVSLFAMAAVGQAYENRKIVGGQPAPVGRYKFIAGLHDSVGESPFCGGSLIAPNVVLTAAHCGSSELVSIGCHDVSVSNEENCETFEVLSVTLNPTYISGLQTGLEEIRDFSVIVFDGVSSNPPIKFLSSGDLELPSDVTFTVIGWGAIFTGDVGSDVLLEVDVESVPKDVCNEKYAPVANGNSVIDDSMLCGASPGKDSCQGDSGGPLFVRCDSSEEDLLVGVVSWGVSCASPHFPGVYANVANATDFIQEIVEEQNHTLEFLSDFDEFCLVGGTKAPTPPTLPPTSFPTFPTAWVCDAGTYATFDGCDCNCGAPDPDCEVETPFQILFGCEEGEFCAEGLCVAEDSFDFVLIGSVGAAIALMALVGLIIFVAFKKKKTAVEQPTHFVKENNVVVPSATSGPPKDAPTL